MRSSDLHRCKQKELQVILVLDDEELNGARETTSPFVADQTPMSDNATNLVDYFPPLSLSLSSMVGLSTPHLRNIQGRIRDPEVVVLIDSGASHNFIADALVKELGLSVASTKDSEVVLGT